VTLLLQILHFFANRRDYNEPSFFDGINMVDPRKVAGKHITSIAKHFTRDAKCKCRCRSNWSTKMLYNVVVNVEKIIKPTAKSCKTVITGTYNLSGGTQMTIKLHLVNIQAPLPADVDDLLVETPLMEKDPSQYLQQQCDLQIDITIQETTINDNRVTKNDTIINYMITEDIIRDIASRAITQALEPHRINTEKALINDSINGNVYNQTHNTIYGPPVASININNNKNKMQW
jgi:hypothetical protein